MSGNDQQQTEGPLVQNEEDVNGAADDDDAKSSMFFTTSDLIQRMNKSVEELSGGDAPGTGFELRRQMPDGSTRRADAADTAVADLQSKIKQTAAVLSGLSAEEKMEWAKAQRKEGNSIFAKGQYNEAMDVYITCLVAMDKLDNDNNDDNGSGADDKKKGETFSEDIERDIQLPVLLNLSLCALKLGMLRKAESFCDFALQTSLGKECPKAYFRRGRARMLMGSYADARIDLKQAFELLSSSTDDETDAARKEEKYAVQKELQKIERLEITAKKNAVKQKKAMKRVWGDTSGKWNGSGSIDNAISKAEERTADEDSAAAPESNTAAHEYQDATKPTIGQSQNNSGLYSDVRERRQFSTLRAKKTVDSDEESSSDDEDCTRQSFVQWYLSLFERCLRKTLRVLGDEEEAEMEWHDKNE